MKNTKEKSIGNGAVQTAAGSSASAQESAATAQATADSGATGGSGGDASADVRIGMWQRSTQRKLAGKLAPFKSELPKFLAEHTDCEVYTGQDVVGASTNGSVGRVAVWHKQKRQK